MQYFVYYNDDYYELAGVGLETFDTENDALRFIEKRMSDDVHRKLDAYVLLKGQILSLEPITTVVKIAVK